MNKLALSILAGATCAGSTPTSRRPVFMPLWNYAFNQGGPDPDYVYSTVEIDPHGVYGSRGSAAPRASSRSRQQAYDMMSPALMRAAGGTSMQQAHDLDDLTLDADGYVQRGPQRRTARRPHRRLVGAATRRPSGC